VVCGRAGLIGSLELNNEFLRDIGRDAAVCARAGLIGNKEPKSEFRLDVVGGDAVGRDVDVCGRAGLIGSIELNSEIFLFVDDVVDEAVVRGRAGLISRFESNSELSPGIFFPVLLEPCEIAVSSVGSETSIGASDILFCETEAAGVVIVEGNSIGCCSRLLANGIASI